VLFAIGAVGACILWLLGYGGAWRLAHYDSILSSLFKYVIVGATLEIYVKDADPLRGGGVIVANYLPHNTQRATAALEAFLGVLLPGIAGTHSGILEVEKKLKR